MVDSVVCVHRALSQKWDMPLELATDLCQLALYDIVIFAGTTPLFFLSPTRMKSGKRDAAGCLLACNADTDVETFDQIVVGIVQRCLDVRG